MKYLLLEKSIKYDGSQLSAHWAYLNYGLLGDSIVSFIGPCDVSPDHMVDGEDLRAGAEIRGSRMLHFIIEIHSDSLLAGVYAQRLLASLATAELSLLLGNTTQLRRDGDDIYFDDRKLSISIATRSTLSTLIHFAINISNSGTPVPTAALEEWSIDPISFATSIMNSFANEHQSIVQATQKVRPV